MPLWWRENCRDRANLGPRHGGVTERPSPSGRGERSPRTQKDNETVEGTSVFGKTFSFAGGRGNEDLGQHASQAPLSLKRSGGARRGGGHSKSFAATGWRRSGARQGREEGSSRNARVLRSALSARMGSCDRPRRWDEGLRLLQNSLGSLWMARLERDGHRANAGETKPREGFALPMRARMMALEGVPVRRIWSAEVGRRRRPKEAASQRQKGKHVNGGPSSRMTILARRLRTQRARTSHQRKPRSAASAPGEAVGEEKPTVGSAMCKVARPTMIHDRWPVKGMRSRELLIERRHLGSRKFRERHGTRSGNDLGGPHRVEIRTKCGSKRAREATEVSEVDRHNQLRNLAFANGTKTPRESRRSAEAIWASWNARFLGPERRNLSGIRRAQVLTMIREQASTGAR